MNRQKLTLAILLVGLVGAVVYSYLRIPRQNTVAKLTYTTGMTGKPRKPEPAQKTADDMRVLLNLLDRKGVGYSGARRNIFKPLFSEQVSLPPLPPPPPPPPQKLATQASSLQHPATAAPVTPGPTPVQRDMARFTFLGFLKKDNHKSIFLSGDRDNIYVVKKGDKIAGRYQIASITDEALIISILPDGGEIIIPLVENQSLRAPRQ